MNTRNNERAAYIAAHRILTADLSAPELACPGARWSHAVDTVAAIIQDVFECETNPKDFAVTRTNRAAEGPRREQNAVLLELRQRASS
jgi:hypothetical protein